MQNAELEQPQPAHARAGLSGEDQMVEHGKVERLPGPDQPTRGAAVGAAGPGIAARVIVGQDQTGTAEPRCGGDDASDRQIDRFRPAFVAFQVEAPGVIIDMRDPQSLPIVDAWLETGSKKPAGGLMPVEQSRKFGTLNLHAELVMEDTPARLSQLCPIRTVRGAKLVLDGVRWRARVGLCGNISI